VEEVIAQDMVSEYFNRDLRNEELFGERYHGRALSKELDMAKHLVAATAKVGGDFRCLPVREFKSDAWPRHSIIGDWWLWRVVISYAWSKTVAAHESINVLEAKAILAALKWRMRKSEKLASRFIHLSDSQVCLGAVRKFRSPSKNLNRVTSRIAAICLASNCKAFFGYIPTDKNPADKPSRDKKSWGDRECQDPL